MTNVSIINNNDSYITQLACPIGISLNSLPSLECLPGVLAYDKSSDLLYTGRVATGSTWQPLAIGATGNPVIAQPFGSSPNANGVTITTDQKLTLQPADASNPGGVNNTTQNFSGVKVFTNGLVVETVSTFGVTNVFNKFCEYTLNGSWTTAITLARSLQLLRIGNSLIIMIPESVQAGSPSGYAVFNTAIPIEFRPAETVGGSLPIWTDGNKGVGYFNLSSAGILTVGISQGVLTNPPGLVAMAGFAVSVSGNTGISDCCIVCRLEL